MTKEEIVRLAIENDLAIEVYNLLHPIVMAELASLQVNSNALNADLRLIKKFANANKLDVIKDILKESESEK